jgi:hypothetical protein
MMIPINTRGQQRRTMLAESANRPDPEVAAGRAVALLLAHGQIERGGDDQIRGERDLLESRRGAPRARRWR